MKKDYYSELSARYNNVIRNTWEIINEVIDNTKNKRIDLPEILLINNNAVVEN